MTDSMKEKASIILDEQSTFGEIKKAIDELYVNAWQVTNMTNKFTKAEHGTI